MCADIVPAIRLRTTADSELSKAKISKAPSTYAHYRVQLNAKRLRPKKVLAVTAKSQERPENALQNGCYYA